MGVMAIVVRNVASVASTIRNAFRIASNAADLKIDAFIFSKQKRTQIRALISGTGLHVIISLEEILTHKYLTRFSAQDQEIINYVIDDSQSLAAYLMRGQSVSLKSKTYDKRNRNILLKVAAFENDENIEFEIDPAELSRNKFLLQLFNKRDAYDIGFAAAESRIRSEQLEIAKAKQR